MVALDLSVPARYHRRYHRRDFALAGSTGNVQSVQPAQCFDSNFKHRKVTADSSGTSPVQPIPAYTVRYYRVYHRYYRWSMKNLPQKDSETL